MMSSRWWSAPLCLALVACNAPSPAATAPPPAAAAKASAAPAAAPAAKTPAPGADAAIPALKIATVDGQMYDLASKRGHWVVVNFWATWCTPCLREMPDLDAFDARRDDVEVLGLAYEEISADEMRGFLDKHPVSYPVAIVDTYNPPADFETPRGLPTTHLIAPDGRIAKSFMGPITSAELTAVIDGTPQPVVGTGEAGAKPAGERRQPR